MERTATFPHAAQDKGAGAEGDFQTAAGAASQPGRAAALSRSPSAAASAGPQWGRPTGQVSTQE